jgi:hypothetical protein
MSIDKAFPKKPMSLGMGAVTKNWLDFIMRDSARDKKIWSDYLAGGRRIDIADKFKISLLCLDQVIRAKKYEHRWRKYQRADKKTT